MLDHVDVIGGNVTGYVDPSDGARYAGALGSPAATNASAKVVKVFNASNWSAAADGTRRDLPLLQAAAGGVDPE